MAASDHTLRVGEGALTPVFVAASDSASFNVEVFLGDEVGRALEGFEAA
jgi:hypothetical protein